MVTASYEVRGPSGQTLSFTIYLSNPSASKSNEFALPPVFNHPARHLPILSVVSPMSSTAYAGSSLPTGRRKRFHHKPKRSDG
jgi:hypothetical protein